MSAVEQLELWKIYQENWCEHKPSVTISVKEDEWFDVGAWCYKHFDMMSGVSFLPFADHTYRQAPYQDCSKQEYEKLVKEMPKEIDWAALKDYEEQDMTTSSQELACSADGGCEIVDLVAV
jgi:ribonucleoside-diphosphate reductase alpha chain